MIFAVDSWEPGNSIDICDVTVNSSREVFRKRESRKWTICPVEHLPAFSRRRLRNEILVNKMALLTLLQLQAQGLSLGYWVTGVFCVGGLFSSDRSIDSREYRRARTLLFR